MNFLLYLTFILYLIMCLFLIMLVLIQKGRGGGLASAFGGGGGNTAFGSKTGDVLTWATSIVFGVFLVLAISMNLLANHSGFARPTGVPTTQQAPPSAPDDVPAPAPADTVPQPTAQPAPAAGTPAPAAVPAAPAGAAAPTTAPSK